MSFWSDPWGAVTGETNHIVKSVEGETNTVKRDVGGYIHHDIGGALAKGRAGLGHAYAYAVRPALPIIATAAATIIPGGQVALPYLISYDVGSYGHALATKGISGFEQVNSRGNIEAGLITAATYGATQALGYGASTTINASSGMNSTELTENLANPGFDPLAQSPLQMLESSALSVYNTAGSAVGGIEKGIGLLSSGLGAYNAVRGAVGQRPVSITGQIGYTPAASGVGTSGIAAGQKSGQQAASSQSSNPAAAGGGFGENNNGNDNLAWTVAIALGVAALAG